MHPIPKKISSVQFSWNNSTTRSTKLMWKQHSENHMVIIVGSQTLCNIM